MQPVCLKTQIHGSFYIVAIKYSYGARLPLIGLQEYLCCRTIKFDLVPDVLQVKEKRAELEKLKSAFVRRASEFLRNYFASLVDFMISDKSYFSQVSSIVVSLSS